MGGIVGMVAGAAVAVGAGATSAVDYKAAVFTIAFKPAPRLEQWDGGAVGAWFRVRVRLVG